MNLEKRIEEWVGHGLLERSQADAILHYEEKAPRRSWAMYGVAGIGICTLMSGVISLIAANWEAISYFGKLAAYFLALSGVGALCVKFSERPGLVREALLSVLSLFVLAGIGLISQIFNLEGEGWQALLMWIVLILPVVLLGDSKLLPNIWFAGFYATLGLWIFSVSKFNLKTDQLMWGVGAMYASLAFSFALAGWISIHFIRTARTWAVLIGLLGGGGMASAIWHSGSHGMNPARGTPVIFALAMCALSAAAIVFRSKEFPRGVAKVAAATVIASGLTIFPPLTTTIIHPNQFIGCVVFLLPWCGVAIASALANRKRLFDLAAFVIGFRLVSVYFEVFGSLAASGIGLMISGGLILGAVYVWHKYRAELADLIREHV